MGGLKSLEYRGYDSAGIAIVEDGKLKVIRRCSGKLKNLEDVLEKEPVTGQFGIGHTRWATHGRPTEENAHPHRDCKGRIVVAHNGIIENYLASETQLSEEGHEFTTETDTEVIAHLMEKNFKGNLEEAVLRTLKGTQRPLRFRCSVRRRSPEDCCGAGRRAADRRQHRRRRIRRVGYSGNAALHAIDSLS